MQKPTFKSSDSAESFDSDNDDTVTLHVGPSGHVLLADASYLTRNSGFFKAVLKKEWAEGQTRVIKLPEDQPHVVAHYLKHIYSNTLPSCVPTADATMTADDYGSRYNQLLAEMYVLGERLLDDSIRFAILRRFIDISSHCASITEAAKTIYCGTTDDSPARQLMVDILVKYGKRDWLDDSCEAANIIYSGKTDVSSTCHLLVDIKLKYGQSNWLDDSGEAAFFLDVAYAFRSNAQAKINSKAPTPALDPSDYVF